MDEKPSRRGRGKFSLICIIGACLQSRYFGICVSGLVSERSCLPSSNHATSVFVYLTLFQRGLVCLYPIALLRFLCIRPYFTEVPSAFVQSCYFGVRVSGLVSQKSRLPLSNHVIFPSHFFTHNETKKEQADRKKMLLVRTTRFQTDCRQSCKWAKIPVHVSNEVKL